MGKEKEKEFWLRASLPLGRLWWGGVGDSGGGAESNYFDVGKRFICVRDWKIIRT